MARTKPKSDLEAFKVHEPEMVHPNQLADAVYNPNKLSVQQYEALKESIREHGFVEPIVVQKIGMRIIGGHHRVRAIKELCIEAAVAIPKILAIVLDVDDATAKRLNLKIQHIHGDPDPRLLGELLVDIFDGAQIQMETFQPLGIEYDDALKYIRIAEPNFPIPVVSESVPPRAFAKAATLSLEFSDAETRDRVKQLLTEQADILKKKSGDVVAERLLPIPKAKAPDKKNGKRAHV